MFWQTFLTVMIVIAAVCVIARRAWKLVSADSGKSCGSCGGCSGASNGPSLTVTPLVQLGGHSPTLSSAKEPQSTGTR